MPSTFPTLCRTKTVEVAPWPGHAGPASSAARSSSQARSVLRRFARILASAAAARCSTGETEAYRVWKRDIVIAALRQVGIDCAVDELIDAHGAGRRRATFHARRTGRDILNVGFAAAQSHHIVPIDRCPILAPALDGAANAAAGPVAQLLDPVKKPLDIQVTATDGGIDMDVRGSGALPAKTSDAARPTRGAASPRAADPPRRTDRAARGTDDQDRSRECRAAAGRISAGHRRRRGNARASA